MNWFEKFILRIIQVIPKTCDSPQEILTKGSSLSNYDTLIG